MRKILPSLGIQTMNKNNKQRMKKIKMIFSKKSNVGMFTGKDGRAIWKKYCTYKRVRTRKENLIKHHPGVIVRVNNAKHPRVLWIIFL